MPEMKPVASSNVSAIGYDDDAGAMHVTFKSGQTYAYPGVEKALFQQTLDAKSVGKFVAAEVAAKFKAEKVPAPASA